MLALKLNQVSTNPPQHTTIIATSETSATLSQGNRVIIFDILNGDEMKNNYIQIFFRLVWQIRVQRENLFNF